MIMIWYNDIARGLGDISGHNLLVPDCILYILYTICDNLKPVGVEGEKLITNK